MIEQQPATGIEVQIPNTNAFLDELRTVAWRATRNKSRRASQGGLEARVKDRL